MKVRTEQRVAVTDDPTTHYFYVGDTVYARRCTEATRSGPYTLTAIEKQGITLTNGKKEADIDFTDLAELTRAAYTNKVKRCVMCEGGGTVEHE